MLGAAAKRIVHPIRKPRNNADEAIAAKPGWDGACRAICCVAPLANGTCHWLRVASCISSRRASVATTWDLFRGSLGRFCSCRVSHIRAIRAVDPCALCVEIQSVLADPEPALARNLCLPLFDLGIEEFLDPAALQ